LIKRLRDYLQLCRFPAVFTAWSDVVLGFLLTHTALAPLGAFAALIGASSGLYLGGMVLNDVFDRRCDAVERPGRPLPSGRVAVRDAVVFAGVLIAGGLASAAVLGMNTLAIALLLTLAVFLYDGVAKSTVFGPLVMGSCRFLNVILAASGTGGRWTGPWQLPQLWVAAALGTYIVGVTWFARQEAGQSRRLPLLGATVVINAGLAALIGLAWGPFARSVSWSGEADARGAGFVMVVIALTINRRLAAAVTTPSPQRVQAAVRLMLLSLISLSASLVYFKLGNDGVAYALGTAALLIPSVVIGRWVFIT